jgi:Ni,Fe-hydrogenase III large subunit/Ni,Fe-hydrogenase III component G
MNETRTKMATREVRRWQRVYVDEAAWNDALDNLASGAWTLFGLWGEHDRVHLAAMDRDDLRIMTVAAKDGTYPSVAAKHPPATRLERTIYDLFGLRGIGTVDQRSWIDHGRWGVKHPLGAAITAIHSPSPYQFSPVEGSGVHQVAVGPVHAGIIEPGHFRFTANGETVVRLEERLGYVHKGIEGLMRGAPMTRGAQLAGRTSGDSTVAYSIAFASAVEDACGIAPPARAVWLRALMGELERLANHLGDIGAVCNDASFSLMHAHCGMLRERVLRAADACFGHRLMRDIVVPGGVARDLLEDRQKHVRELIQDIERAFPELVELYDNTASLQDRTVGTGVLRSELAMQYGCGGFVGRASGREFDARQNFRYAPYDELQFKIPTRREGDVNARVWIRIDEVYQSLSLLKQIIDKLPGTDIRAELPTRLNGAQEGLAVVEGFRGDVLVWVRLDQTLTIERCHLRDPSWFHWPVLEAAIEGNIIADFPLCNKSFNCSYSGHDL